MSRFECIFRGQSGTVLLICLPLREREPTVRMVDILVLVGCVELRLSHCSSVCC